MQRKGIRYVWGIGLLLLAWFIPAQAEDNADEIAAMMAWWDEYGSYWDEVDEVIEFAGETSVYTLAENTLAVEESE